MQQFIRENAMHPQGEDFYDTKLAEYEKQRAEGETRLKGMQSQKAARLSRKGIAWRTGKCAGRKRDPDWQIRWTAVAADGGESNRGYGRQADASRSATAWRSKWKNMFLRQHRTKNVW